MGGHRSRSFASLRMTVGSGSAMVVMFGESDLPTERSKISES